MRAVARPRVWILSALGVVILCALVYLAWPRRPGQPKVPEELAELGDDPDGDGISTEEELRQGSDPLVADYPHLQFTFRDVEFGLRVDSKHVSVEDRLAVRSRDLVAVRDSSRSERKERAHSETSQEIAFAGQGILQAGPWEVPVSYAGRHGHESIKDTWKHQSVYEVRDGKLERIRDEYKKVAKVTRQAIIRPDAGYFRCRLTVASSLPCRLENFGVNFRVNGHSFPTRQATSSRNFKALNLGRTGGAGELVLEFEGLNTQELRDVFVEQGGVTVSCEVPQMTVELSQFSDAERHRKLLAGIQSRCALVEVRRGGSSAFHYVSTAAGRDEYALPLRRFLTRVPGAGEVRWAQGPMGDYLATFGGQDGVGLFTPEMRPEGRWVLAHQGVVVEGDSEQRTIRPSEYLKLQYVSAAEHWGDLDEWKGYVATYRALRDLGALEGRFWTEVEDCDTKDDNPWGALAEQRLLVQGRKIADRHSEYLTMLRRYPILQRYCPVSPGNVANFRRWFTGTRVLLPRYNVRVTGARIWWNVDRKIDPQVVVRCNGKEVTGSQFSHDPKGRSGTVTLAKGNTFEWSPFDRIDLEIRDRDRPNGTLLSLQFRGYQAASGLLDEHPLDGLAGADPEVRP